MKNAVLIASFLLSFIGRVFGQITPEQIDNLISSKEKMQAIGIANPEELKKLYNKSNNCVLWMTSPGKINRASLIQLIGRSPELGLNKEDYQYSFLASSSEVSLTSESLPDSIEVELRFSDAAIHFFSDLVYGNISPAFGYDGLNYSPRCYDIPGLISNYISTNQLNALFERLIDITPQVTAIRKKLERITGIMCCDTIQEEKISSSQVNSFNTPLLKKLYLLGITDSMDKRPDILIKNDLVEAQRQFNLLADGILRATAISELNVPLETRIRQLNLSINYYRWLSCLSQEKAVVVVNIPAAYLKVYAQDTTLLEMRMVVGKPSTPTPTLTSTVTEVILYPYWSVPHSIATKELLPAIKRNPAFIDANNFQVISNTGKIVDPYKINWQLLNASNFPYTIRQSTGCDNALGLIKLNFYNPIGVYLHDTPDKSLFLLNKRYFSHGCMRMEKPMDLGYLVLKDNGIAIDTLEEKGCIRNQAPITVPADERMPVVVWYNPVDIDATGRVVFYEDVYKKFTAKNPVALGNKPHD